MAYTEDKAAAPATPPRGRWDIRLLRAGIVAALAAWTVRAYVLESRDARAVAQMIAATNKGVLSDVRVHPRRFPFGERRAWRADAVVPVCGRCRRVGFGDALLPNARAEDCPDHLFDATARLPFTYSLEGGCAFPLRAPADAPAR